MDENVWSKVNMILSVLQDVWQAKKPLINWEFEIKTANTHTPKNAVDVNLIYM